MYTIEELIRLVWVIFWAMSLYRIFVGILTKVIAGAVEKLQILIEEDRRRDGLAQTTHKQAVKALNGRTIGFKSMDE